MTENINEMTIFSCISGFILIVAIYEFITGRIPGDPVRRGLWGYRWIKTPSRQRFVVIVGVLAVVGFLFIERPFALKDLIAGGLGGFLGLLIVSSDARSHSRFN